MRLNRSSVILLASAISVAVAAPAMAQTPYDGLWNVTIVTKTGSCEPSARSTLSVADGKVSAAGPVAGHARERAGLRVACGAGHRRHEQGDDGEEQPPDDGDGISGRLRLTAAKLPNGRCRGSRRMPRSICPNRRYR